MALVGHPFPYDVNNLLSGAVSIYYGLPSVVDIPAGIEDVILMEAPYTVQTGWTALGATKEAFSYSRSFETEGLDIQQSSTAIFEEITDTTRTLTVSQAEFSPFGFQLMENAPSVDTLAAATGVSAQKRIAFGNFTSVTRYRFAFLSRRPKGSGLVTESDATTTRGRFVMGVAFNAGMAADEITMEQGKGELTAVELAFTLFTETDDPQPEGEEVGAWFIEEAGTIA